jgi:hypothetical protein
LSHCRFIAAGPIRARRFAQSATFPPRPARRFSGGLAILLERNVDDGETASFLWKAIEICLDEDLDGFLARINLDASRGISKINLVPPSILLPNDGMGHF